MFSFTFLRSQSTLTSRGLSLELRKNLSKTKHCNCIAKYFWTHVFTFTLSDAVIWSPEAAGADVCCNVSTKIWCTRFNLFTDFLSNYSFYNEIEEHRIVQLLIFSNTLYSLRLWSSQLLSIWTAFAAIYLLPHRYCTEFKIIQSSLLSAYFWKTFAFNRIISRGIYGFVLNDTFVLHHQLFEGT